VAACSVNPSSEAHSGLSYASACGSASAQDSWKSDAFVGYSMLAVDGETMHGGHAALGFGLSGHIGLLLDASVHQGSDAAGTDVDLLSLMAGPRVKLGGGRVQPFLHVIGGIVRTQAGVRIFDIEISESATDLGDAAGGGFDVGLGDRWALRLAGEYRVVKIADETATDPRFSAGVVYRFGAR
jgi:opacity protein-like surface antigen